MQSSSHADVLFGILKDVPLSDLPKLLEESYQDLFPKKSKTLITNLLKDISLTSEPRLLVIIGHLYFDYILEKILEREAIPLSQRKRESFYAKLEIIYKRELLEDSTYESLRAINQLRNRFAHDIFFDIVHWDAKTIPYVSYYQLRIPKRRDLLRAFNIAVVKLTFFALPQSLINQHRWLNLHDVPSQ